MGRGQREPASPNEDLRPSPHGHLDAALAAWRRAGLWRHATAVVLLALVAALRWSRWVASPEPLSDEIIYLNAFRSVIEGLSPFERSGYLSLSLLAHLGGWWMERFGEGATLAALRSLNLLGLATAVWCALAWAPWSSRRRWIVGAIYLAISPAVAFGVFVGNLSLLVSGMIIVALMIWPRRPAASGVLLAGSIVAKPLAPGAVLALLAHRPAERTRCHLIAGGVAVVLTAVVALASPELERALAIDPWLRLSKSVSPHKLALLVGARWAVPLVSVAVGAITIWLARRRPRGPTQTLGLALAAAVGMTPVVWSHTLLVTLPLQTAALALLMARYPTRHAGPGDALARRRRLVEVGLVVLSVAALQLSTGAWNIYDAPLAVQWLGLLPPMLAPWVLTGYLLRDETV